MKLFAQVSLLILVVVTLLITLSVSVSVVPCSYKYSISNVNNKSAGKDETETEASSKSSNNSNGIECSLETLGQDPHEIKCIDEDTIRIVGEYKILRIFCTAKFALNLEYSGFQPTEAIKVQFSKETYANSSRKLKHYELEIDVYSVQALYDKFHGLGGNTASSLIDDKHKNSRTGRFKIHDVFNTTRQKSIYLFLEDELSSLALMRNQHSMQVIHESDGSGIVIPCRPSHLYANVTLSMEISDNKTTSIQELYFDDKNVTFSAKQGFRLQHNSFINYTRNRDTKVFFVCKLTDVAESAGITDKDTGNVGLHLTPSTLRFAFPPVEKMPRFGFEDLPKDSIQENINIHSQVVVVDTYNFQINIDCTVDNPNGAVLTAIEAKSPAHSHLLQEFVFPNYINGSYSGVYGVKSSPPGVLTLKGLGLAGLVFCMAPRLTSNETDYKVLEYATGFDRKVRFFKYGQDWSYFDVTLSPAVNHLQITPGTFATNNGFDQSGIVGYYVNKIYTFRLRVRVHGLCAPVIWYHKYENGTEIEEYIDYTLDDQSFSYFNMTITPTTKEVIAAASFWDRELWKNVSLPISPTRKVGLTPIITNTNFELHFIIGAPNQVLKCEARGDPIPNLRWEKGTQLLASQNSTDSLILEFPKINVSHAGIYTCIARNILGTISQSFTVETVEEDKVNYAVSIGIPAVVFALATIGTYLYFRFIKKEPVGLTKKEIEDFEQGSPEFTKEMGNYMVPENALHVPYNKEYEVEDKYFQISTSEVLGSGQFGVVYRGIMKGQPVAVKTLKPNADKDYLKALLSELKIMCYLGKHEHLVQLLGANTKKLSKGTVYVFVEMCSGSLEHFLRNNRNKFVSDLEYGKSSYYLPEEDTFNAQQLYTWSYQISKAMEYLGSKKVIHGDLSTRNVLLDADKQAKVTDFGLSRQLYNYELYVKTNQEPLPWRWMAIESLRDLVFSVQSDAWSFGIAMWEIFTLAEVPYPGLAWDLEFIEKLEKGLRMLKPKYATQKLYEDVMLPSWGMEPESRPSFETMSQYLLDLILVKPLPAHYIKQSDLITKMQVQAEVPQEQYC